LLEFVLVAPMFLISIFAIAEGALFFNAVATIDNAAREGARVAALCGSNIGPASYYGAAATSCSGQVHAAVINNLGILPLGTTPDNPDVPPPSPVTQAGSVMQVTVSYQYSLYIPSYLGLKPTFLIQASAPVVAQQ
jgi:Flp pilus assembly protein TadG